MSKIVSFGDSFIFGYEISNNNGNKNWPSFAAKKLDADHICYSSPGVGNDTISRQIFEYYSTRKNFNDIAIINWTWTLRWDFYINFKDWFVWTTFGPNQSHSFSEGLSLKDLKKWIVDKTWQPPHIETSLTDDIQKTYNVFIRDNELFNKFRALQTISSCNNFLNLYNIKNVQTFMDYEIIDQEWHAPDYITSLQSTVIDKLVSFDGLNFLDWSKKNNFKVTEPGWHPLEDAHKAAAEYWLPTYKELLELD